MISVYQALALIPGRRDELNAIDDRLSRVIRYVERVLTELKVSVSVEIVYKTDDGSFFLGYGKWGGMWQILYGVEAEDDHTADTGLLSAPRHVRAEVFSIYPGNDQSPIEQLIVTAAQTLADCAQERSPQLARAMSLASVLTQAGFSDNDSSSH